MSGPVFRLRCDCGCDHTFTAEAEWATHRTAVLLLDVWAAQFEAVTG